MRFFVCLIVACVVASGLKAQEYVHVYTDGEIFTVDQTTFRVEDVNELFFAVQNAQNELAERNPVDENGNEVSPFDIESGIMDRASIHEAFFATFTEEEAARLRDKQLRVTIYLTCDSAGKVLEVVFLLFRNAGAYAISPNQFAAFEHNLKSRVRWKELSNDEKRLSFTHSMIKLNMRRLVPPRKVNEDSVGGEPFEGEAID